MSYISKPSPIFLLSCLLGFTYFSLCLKSLSSSLVKGCSSLAPSNKSSTKPNSPFSFFLNSSSSSSISARVFCSFSSKFCCIARYLSKRDGISGRSLVLNRFGTRILPFLSMINLIFLYFSGRFPSFTSSLDRMLNSFASWTRSLSSRFSSWLSLLTLVWNTSRIPFSVTFAVKGIPRRILSPSLESLDVTLDSEITAGKKKM